VLASPTMIMKLRKTVSKMEVKPEKSLIALLTGTEVTLGEWRNAQDGREGMPLRQGQVQ
jgi:hypothetical protein